MGRRGRFAALVFAMTVITGGVALALFSPNGKKQSPLRPLEDCLRSETESGWHLIHTPDRSGPYRREGMAILQHGEGKGGAEWKRGTDRIRHQFDRLAGMEQIAVALETADGQLTVAVLARERR
jgi:hypothetical protein